MFKGIIFSKDVSERAPGGNNITIVLSSLSLEFYNVRYCFLFLFFLEKSIGIDARLNCIQALFYLVAVKPLQALTFPSVKWR